MPKSVVTNPVEKDRHNDSLSKCLNGGRVAVIEEIDLRGYRFFSENTHPNNITLVNDDLNRCNIIESEAKGANVVCDTFENYFKRRDIPSHNIIWYDTNHTYFDCLYLRDHKTVKDLRKVHDAWRDMLTNIENLGIFAYTCSLRYGWARAGEIEENLGIVTPEDMGDIYRKGWIVRHQFLETCKKHHLVVDVEQIAHEQYGHNHSILFMAFVIIKREEDERVFIEIDD